MLKNSVGKVCATCMFSCYKESCDRKDWQEKTYPPMPKVGKDTVCPMMQFEAKKPAKKEYDSFGGLTITVKDTMDICRNCKYQKESNTMEGFESHCFDCPNQQMRESLKETMAESMCC